MGFPASERCRSAISAGSVSLTLVTTNGQIGKTRAGRSRKNSETGARDRNEEGRA